MLKRLFALLGCTLLLALTGCGPAAPSGDWPVVTLAHRADEDLYAVGVEYALDGTPVGSQVASTDQQLKIRLLRDDFAFQLELPDREDWQGGLLTVDVYATAGEERQHHLVGTLEIEAQPGDCGRWEIIGSGDSFALTQPAE